MAVLHMILQSKGGVGKSMIASILYQGLTETGKNVVAYDTDPENSTFGSYKEFSVTVLKIKDGDNIDKAAFDGLFEAICELPENTHVVVDSGSTSFGALSSYIKANRAIRFLQENGHSVYLHTVITGGQAITDTIGSLKRLAIDFPDTPLVVWLNPYFGKIAMDGKLFEDFQIYKDHAAQFNSIIKLPDADELLSRNLSDLYAKRMSFAAGINSSMGLMARNRINRFWSELVELFRQADFAA